MVSRKPGIMTILYEETYYVVSLCLQMAAIFCKQDFTLKSRGSGQASHL